MATRAAAALFVVLALAPLGASAQNPAALLTRADVEKVTGAKFGEAQTPMPEQATFAQDGGDLQISIDVEAREGDASVRTWAATMKKMQPSTKVETVPGLGADAIYWATRPDLGKVSADFEKPRIQMSVSISGAATPEAARRIVVELAKIAASRVR